MYCVKCGNKIDENQKYCTSCGYNQEKATNNNNNNDTSNVGLNIVGFLWPLIGLVIFLCIKDTTPKKAKKIGKWALIGLIAKIITAIISFILLITFAAFVETEDENNYKYDFYDSDTHEDYKHNFYDDNNELDDFIDAIEYYNLLATKQFYEDAYTNKELTDVCYDIKDLEKTNYYFGSIEAKVENNKLKTIIWLTDYKYSINGIEYDNYKYQDIVKGDKITNSCKSNNSDNSL